MNVRRGVVGSDGNFEVSELPDGEYLVSVRGPFGWAEATVTIAGRTPDALTLTLRPDRVVAGRVEFVGKNAAAGRWSSQLARGSPFPSSCGPSR